MIRPLFNQVLIEPEEKTEIGSGRVALPASMKEKPMRGKVVSAGFQAYKLLQPGCVVYFRRYAGDPVEVELGRELLLVADDDILGMEILDSQQSKQDDKDNEDNSA